MLDQALFAFASGAGRGLTSSAPTSLQSGAPADMRAGFSNAGWTVATGGGRAEGAQITGDPTQAAYGYTPAFAAAPSGGLSTAGGGLMMPLLIGGAVLAFIIARKKKG